MYLLEIKVFSPLVAFLPPTLCVVPRVQLFSKQVALALNLQSESKAQASPTSENESVFRYTLSDEVWNAYLWLHADKFRTPFDRIHCCTDTSLVNTKRLGTRYQRNTPRCTDTFQTSLSRRSMRLNFSNDFSFLEACFTFRSLTLSMQVMVACSANAGAIVAVTPGWQERGTL